VQCVKWIKIIVSKWQKVFNELEPILQLESTYVMEPVLNIPLSNEIALWHWA